MKKKKITKWKIPNIVFLVFMIIILVLYGQYIYLSLSKSVYGINMNEFAKNRNTVTKEKIAERGKIFDVNGEVLALNVTSYTLIAYLDDSRVGSNGEAMYVKDKEATAASLASVLDADYDYILDKSPTDVKINLYPLPSSISLLSLTTSNLFSRKSFMYKNIRLLYEE